MHRLRRLACFLALLAACGSAWGVMDRAEFIRLGSSVLKIEVARRQGGYAIGSGVLVAPGRLVTNCHVTRDARRISVIRWGTRWPVQAQAVDARHDLCMLRVDGLDDHVVPMGRANSLRVGQRVTAMGYTGGAGLQSTEGDVVALHRYDDAPVIQSTNWFSSGASGGALFDEDMRLVGILTFRMRGGEAHYFAAPIEWIERQLLPGAKYEDVAPIDGADMPYWQLPPGAQPEFLQAVTLMKTEKWAELKELAQRWSASAQQDPYPWHARGIAEEGLERLQDALAAFERAVALDPKFASGWLYMGLLSARLGLMDKAREALAALRGLSDSFADRLAERVLPQ